MCFWPKVTNRAAIVMTTRSGRFYQGLVPRERVYLCPAGNGTHRNRLAFRDHLIAHPEAAAEYAALKRRLAGEFRMDGDGYTAHKREFVDAIVARALADDR